MTEKCLVLVKSIDFHAALDGRGMWVSVKCSNPTGDCRICAVGRNCDRVMEFIQRNLPSLQEQFERCKEEK